MERRQQIESLFHEALQRRTKTGPSRESRAIAIVTGSTALSADIGSVIVAESFCASPRRKS